MKPLSDRELNDQYNHKLIMREYARMYEVGYNVKQSTLCTSVDCLSWWHEILKYYGENIYMIYISKYIQDQLDKIENPNKHLLEVYSATLEKNVIIFNDVNALLKFAKDFNL